MVVLYKSEVTRTPNVDFGDQYITYYTTLFTKNVWKKCDSHFYAAPVTLHVSPFVRVSKCISLTPLDCAVQRSGKVACSASNTG